MSVKQAEKDLEWIFSKKKTHLKSLGLTSPAQFAKTKKALLQINVKANPVIMKITSHTHVKSKGVISHLKYLSREKGSDGEKYVLNDHFGDEMDVSAMERFNDEAMLRAKAFGKGKNQRVTTNLMLTKPHLLSSSEFRENAVDWLRETFPENEYVYTFHDDSTEHMHVAVAYYNDLGRPLNPRKSDIMSWREGFADIVNKDKNFALVTALSANSRGKFKSGYKRSIVEAEAKKIKSKSTREKSSLDTERDLIAKRRNALLRLYYFAKDEAKDSELADHLSEQVKNFDNNFGTSFKVAKKQTDKPEQER